MNYFIKKESIKKFALLIILVFTALFRASTFMGMAEGDDLYYTQLAHRAASGDLSANFIFNIRWAVFLPSALLYKLFGVNDLTSYIPVFIAGILSAFLFYKILERETRWETAFIGSCLYISFPVILVYGNFLQVAPFLELFTLSAVFFAQKAALKNKFIYYALFGFFAGLNVYTRITGLFIAPLLCLYIFYKLGFNRKMLLGFILAAAVSLVPFAIQGAVYLSIHGNFFHYFKVSKNAVKYQNSMTDVDPKDLFFYIRTMFVKEGFANWTYFGFTGYALIASFAAALVLWIKRSVGKEVIFLLWFIAYFIFMTFTPTNVDPYTTMIRNIRYSIVFIAPICGFIAILLSKFIYSQNTLVKSATFIVLCFLFFSNAFFSFSNSIRYKSFRDKQKDSIDYVLENFEDKRIYLADKNIGRRIRYYSGYKISNFQHITSLKQIKEEGVFLLLGPGSYSKTRFFMPKKKLKEIKKNPPWGLKLVKKLPYFRVYSTNPGLL